MNTLRNDLIKAALTGAMANPSWTDQKISVIVDSVIIAADAILAKLNASESPITGSAEVDWSKAPDWAEWHSWDYDDLESVGHWFIGHWFQERPHWNADLSIWDTSSRYSLSNLPKPANLAARDSLTRRPGK